jgi:formate hydrogenlyase subunit 3/multisubunit Na+/H+ antiporter MnhD subunit
MRLVIRCGLVGFLLSILCACVFLFLTGGSQANDSLVSPEWLKSVGIAFLLTPIGLVAGLIIGGVLLHFGKKSPTQPQDST